ncbi:MAG TPA: calcium/proton exchanger [Candidatus Dormibacteraeota bacterium]|nr:calcium/proton exchanger [Candidatus Dormibacteraeota bacterium]
MLARIAYALSIGGSAFAVLLRLLNADATLTFAVSALAILGLAYTLGHATEELGAAAGPRIGGILNATVGNIGEIIIAGFLIASNELDVVKASITGSIVGNLLLVLGASLLVGGLKNGVQRFDPQATGMNAASLILATIGLIVPATFAALIGAGAETGAGSSRFFSIEALSIGVAVVLLLTYAAQTWFYFSTPEATAPGERDPTERATWSVRQSLGVLLGTAAALTVVSEVLVHSLDPMVNSLGISKFFVGIILIPLIGNLAEHVVGITLAYKNKMDFSLTTSLGSATQIALFAAPVLVFFGLLVGNELTLVFTPLEVVAVATGTLIAAYIALDGRSNWVEGLQLISVYTILAIAFFFVAP